MSSNIRTNPAVIPSSRSSLSRLLWAAPLAMLLAAAANLALYYAVGVLFPSVTAWSGAGPGQIVGANCAYLTMGALAFVAVARLSRRPARHYVIVAAAGLLLSLALPIAAGFGYAAPGALPANAITVLTLSLMHVISAAISVPLFLRYGLRA
jgi:hypothetical protein